VNKRSEQGRRSSSSSSSSSSIVATKTEMHYLMAGDTENKQRIVKEEVV
jgi:hypothetical protein